MEIRKAQVEDSKLVSKIYYKSAIYSYKDYLPKEYLDSLKENQWEPLVRMGLKSGKLNCLIAYEDEEPAGATCYQKSTQKGYEEDLELGSIYIRPKYFRMGIGHKFLEEIKAYGMKNNFSRISLWVLKENTPGRNFYEKEGFVKGEEKTFKAAKKETSKVRYILDLEKIK